MLSVWCKTLSILALKPSCYHGVTLASQSGPNSKPVLGGCQLLNIPTGIGIGSFFLKIAYPPGTGIGSGQPSAAKCKPVSGRYRLLNIPAGTGIGSFFKIHTSLVQVLNPQGVVANF